MVTTRLLVNRYDLLCLANHSVYFIVVVVISISIAIEPLQYIHLDHWSRRSSSMIVAISPWKLIQFWSTRDRTFTISCRLQIFHTIQLSWKRHHKSSQNRFSFILIAIVNLRIFNPENFSKSKRIWSARIGECVCNNNVVRATRKEMCDVLLRRNAPRPT